MPIYEYRCDNGHEFETFQSMSEEPLSKCMECGAPSQRVLSAPAIHYKGSGFYTTDYARKQNKSSGSESSSSSGGEGSGSDSSKDSSSSSSSSSGSSSDSKKSTAKD